MINLNRIPRTDAESYAAYLLTEAAHIGKLYNELFMATPTTNAYEDFDYAVEQLCPFDDVATEYFLSEAVRQFKQLRIANEHAQEFVRSAFIKAIADFNKACDKIKGDPRDRLVILKSEGWRETEKGWTRGKITATE